MQNAFQPLHILHVIVNMSEGFIVQQFTSRIIILVEYTDKIVEIFINFNVKCFYKI